ncbi:ATP synthase subunit delta [Aspergillus ochraceoroseus]|uniref:ATP synthase subunit delta, mitochondrial n=1 Tax=Aspergillus ochraceoroseus TaxID=138278 RepID=A0A0F8TXF5_9EURO|nr:ATP synthase subunit delta [Aspergillus ochraceoroseus]
MSSLRFARSALRARPSAIRVPVQRRGYAEAVSDKIKLSLVLPHQVNPDPDHFPLHRRVCLLSTSIESASRQANPSVTTPLLTSYASSVQVNIPAESGEMGVLANHVPSIEQLKPGLVEIVEEGGASKKFFLSGGFAVVQPDSQLSINAVEGFPLEDFSAENVRSQIAEAQKIASGNGSEQDIAEAKIELEVLETLQAVLK